MLLFYFNVRVHFSGGAAIVVTVKTCALNVRPVLCIICVGWSVPPQEGVEIRGGNVSGSGGVVDLLCLLRTRMESPPRVTLLSFELQYEATVLIAELDVALTSRVLLFDLVARVA